MNLTEIENIYKNKTMRNRILIYLYITEYIKKISGYKMKYIAKCIISYIKVGATASPFTKNTFFTNNSNSFESICINGNIEEIDKFLANVNSYGFITDFLYTFFTYYNCGNIEFVKNIINRYRKKIYGNVRINYYFYKNKYLFDNHNITIRYYDKPENKNIEKIYNLAQWGHPVWKYVIKLKIEGIGNSKSNNILFNILEEGRYYDKLKYIKN